MPLCLKEKKLRFGVNEDFIDFEDNNQLRQ